MEEVREEGKETEHTFLALQCHSALQVVHLKLEAFQRPVGIASLSFVGDQHSDDGDEQNASARADPDDGG